MNKGDSANMNEEIQKRLANIFKDTFNIIVENISNYGDKELLDRDYNLAARDLVILVTGKFKRSTVHVKRGLSS